MKTILALSFWVFFSFPFTGLRGQVNSSAEVSEPRLELQGNSVHIYYDISGSQPSETFTITVVVEDEQGNAIRASSLEGDVGKKISGGSNKHIIWNYEEDNVFLNAEIEIRVNASVEKPRETPKESPGEAGRAGIILQSVALPGLGLTKVTGKPHWIKGVAGYGCIAGSVVMNRMAISTYNSISDLETDVAITEAYDKSVQQDQVSEILAYAAIGIWVTEFVWTLVGTSHMKKSSSLAASKGISLKSDFDPISNAPQLGIVLTF